MSKLLEIAENIFPQLLKYIESLPKTEMRYYWINECDSNNLSPFERLCFNQRILAIAENETQGQFILRMIEYTVGYNSSSKDEWSVESFSEEGLSYLMKRILSDECLNMHKKDMPEELTLEQMQKIVEFITTGSTTNEYKTCPITEVPKDTFYMVADTEVFYMKEDCHSVADLTKADIWNWRRLKDHLYQNGYAPEIGVNTDMADIKIQSAEWKKQATAEAEAKMRKVYAKGDIVNTITKGIGKDVVSELVYEIVEETETDYILKPLNSPNAKLRNVPKERVIEAKKKPEM